jgi:hypothetical protein
LGSEISLFCKRKEVPQLLQLAMLRRFLVGSRIAEQGVPPCTLRNIREFGTA